MSPLSKCHLPNLRSLFQRGTCVSRSSKFSVKGCFQSGTPCVGSCSSISSSVCAEPRFPEACLSGFVCIGFPHACLALRVVIGSDDVSDSPEDFDWSFGLDVEAELLLEDDDNPGTTRGTKLSIFQVMVLPFLVNRGVLPFFHSYEHPCSEQSLPSDRTAGVSSSNCTATNRSRS